MEDKKNISNEDIQKLIDRGEKASSIFDEVILLKNLFKIVGLNGIGCNFINNENQLIWKGERWFDTCYDFYDGFMMVKIDGKGYNFLKEDWTLLWKGNEWFEEYDIFQHGKAKVKLHGKLYQIDSYGSLIDID